jgi:hypothetical protein
MAALDAGLDIDRIHGSTNFVANTLFSVTQTAAYLIQVFEDDGSTAINLTAQDGGDGTTGVSGQLIEAIVRECQPLMYMAAPSGDTNAIYMIVDNHAVDAATLQARIRNLGATSSNQRNFVSSDGDGTTTTIDIGGTTVTLGTAITVA